MLNNICKNIEIKFSVALLLFMSIRLGLSNFFSSRKLVVSVRVQSEDRGSVTQLLQHPEMSLTLRYRFIGKSLDSSYK